MLKQSLAKKHYCQWLPTKSKHLGWKRLLARPEAATKTWRALAAHGPWISSSPPAEMNQAHGPQLCHRPQGTWAWRWSHATRGLWGSRTSCIAHPTQGVTDPEPNHCFWQRWQGVNDFRPALRRGLQVDGQQRAARPQPTGSHDQACGTPTSGVPLASDTSGHHHGLWRQGSRCLYLQKFDSQGAQVLFRDNFSAAVTLQSVIVTGCASTGHERRQALISPALHKRRG